MCMKGTHSEVRRVVGPVENQGPPGLEHISSKVHACDNNRTKSRWLVSHRIIGPRKEGGLDAVDAPRPVIRRELACD